MPKRSKNPSHSKAVFVILFVIILLGGLLLWRFAKFAKPAVQYVFKKDIELKESDKNVNMLLLGIGGGRHDGPLLTDTIIFASIDNEHKRVTLVSIPRDLWIPNLDAKINHAYAYGEEKKQGGGLLLAKKVVEEVVGQEIDYGFRIDFSGFEKAVDEVGGLDVLVQRTFDDYAYPLSGKENESCGLQDDEIASLSAQIATGSATELESFPCRYEHLHFDEGEIHMDGETALKYVRSRHALGPEGSDFARSKRQEKVISAFKEKIFSLGTILNPLKVNGLLNILQGSIDTDIAEDEYDDFIKLAQKMQDAKIQSAVVDFGDEEEEREGLLINPPTSEEFRYQFVLIPRRGTEDYSEIHSYVTCMIKTGQPCNITPLPTQ
jgi:polyisoprenyl-teichoic acid--peptidoglycan teichoic acid transferase